MSLIKPLNQEKIAETSEALEVYASEPFNIFLEEIEFRLNKLEEAVRNIPSAASPAYSQNEMQSIINALKTQV